MKYTVPHYFILILFHFLISLYSMFPLSAQSIDSNTVHLSNKNIIFTKDSVVYDTLYALQSDSSFGLSGSVVILDSLQTSNKDSTLAKENKPFRIKPNYAFQVGEHLEFDIAYKFITAGTAIMSIPDTQWVQNRACYHIVTTAESNSFFTKFYKVRDRVETFIDIDGLFPWKFEKHIREGKYKSDRYVQYDQRNHIVYGHKDTLNVAPYIQGVLSSFYYVRTLPLIVGEHVDIENYGDGKVYPLRILVHKKEKVKVPAGKFKCIKIEPVLRTEGIFKQKGKLTIWLTDDERRIPVLMKSKIMIGSIDCRLRKIKNKLEQR